MWYIEGSHKLCKMVAERLLVKTFVTLNLETETSIRGKWCVVLSINRMSRQRTRVEEGGWASLGTLRKCPRVAEGPPDTAMSTVPAKGTSGLRQAVPFICC